MTKNRVVITGIGTVNPIGNNCDEYWSSLISGKSGIEKIDYFDVSEFPTQIAGVLHDFNLKDYFDNKEIKRTSKFILYAVVAALEAVKLSGLDIEKISHQVGVEIGSGIGGIEILEKMANTLKDKGPSKVSPFTVPMMITDMAAGFVAIKTGAKGPNSCSVSACASAGHSMGNAFHLIQNGSATAMLCGGTEACVTPLGLASFCAARSLSQRNDDPKKASRPFDKDREGFVMGEGAGVLVFEELNHARERGANILAEVIGFGSSGDAYHITAPAPEGEGASRAVKMALNSAGVKPNEVDYINAHGTSTHLNDKNETAAFKSVFGDHAYNVSISSTKSMTGHLLGAAGAIELIACTQAILNSKIPPTINLDTPDPDCNLNYTPHNAIDREVNIAMSTSFGFGGHNAVLLVKKYS